GGIEVREDVRNKQLLVQLGRARGLLATVRRPPFLDHLADRLLARLPLRQVAEALGPLDLLLESVGHAVLALLEGLGAVNAGAVAPTDFDPSIGQAFDAHLGCLLGDSSESGAVALGSVDGSAGLRWLQDTGVALGLGVLDEVL